MVGTRSDYPADTPTGVIITHAVAAVETRNQKLVVRKYIFELIGADSAADAALSRLGAYDGGGDRTSGGGSASSSRPLGGSQPRPGAGKQLPLARSGKSHPRTQAQGKSGSARSRIRAATDSVAVGVLYAWGIALSLNCLSDTANRITWIPAPGASVGPAGVVKRAAEAVRISRHKTFFSVMNPLQRADETTVPKGEIGKVGRYL